MVNKGTTKVLRDGVDIVAGAEIGYNDTAATGRIWDGIVSYSFVVDALATTASTFKLQAKMTTVGTFKVNNSGESWITITEIQ